MSEGKNKLDIQYIRYVDDIRIFSKDKISAQKAIASPRFTSERFRINSSTDQDYI